MARTALASRSSTLRDLETHLGRGLRQTRRSIGWSQSQLAGRAGISSSMVRKVEKGGNNSSLKIIVAMADALGMRLNVRIDAPFLTDRISQRDPAHARCVSYCRRRLERTGWRTDSEVEIGGRWLGWIDIVAYDPRSRTLLIIEVKTELHDVGGLDRQLGRYGREAWAVARRLGWPTSRVVQVVLFLATEANDERLSANRDLLRMSFPVRAAELAATIADPTISWPHHARALAMVDPLRRRVDWLVQAKIDGRRRPAPYVDYADFMKHIRQGGRRRG